MFLVLPLSSRTDFGNNDILGMHDAVCSTEAFSTVLAGYARSTTRAQLSNTGNRLVETRDVNDTQGALSFNTEFKIVLMK